MSKPSGVYMFMGVNGVGKSTLVEGLAPHLPEARVVHASAELRKLFGGLSYAELEQIDPVEKLQRRADHFTKLFHEVHSQSGLVLMDTHLLVAIRQGPDVRYENTWSPNYSEFVHGAFMVTANPADIRTRRERDIAATGRVRDIDEFNIRQDQELNVQEFESLIAAAHIPSNAEVVSNDEGLAHQLGELVLAKILS